MIMQFTLQLFLLTIDIKGIENQSDAHSLIWLNGKDVIRVTVISLSDYNLKVIINPDMGYFII
jgi:hypothetical protein